MAFRMMSPRMANESGKENVVDVIPGLSKEFTIMGDKVRVMYQVYNKNKLFVDEGGPLIFTLGDQQYGPEFDEGLCGMKANQTRQIYMKPNKKLRSRKFVRDLLWKLKLKRLPDYEYYQVTVVALLDENGVQRSDPVSF